MSLTELIARALLAVVLTSATAIGWGALVLRLFRVPVPLPGLCGATGLATLCVFGGVLNLAGLVLPPVLWLLVLVGVSGLMVRWREQPFPLRPLGWLALAVLPAAIGGATGALNPHDDLQGYLVFPVRMLETGSFGPDVFNERRMLVFGAQSFLQCFVLLVAQWRSVPVLESGVALWLLLLLVHDIARARVVWLVPVVLLVTAIELQPVNVAALLTSSVLLLALANELRGERTAGSTVRIALFVAGTLSLKHNLVAAVAPLFAARFVADLWCRQWRTGLRWLVPLPLAGLMLVPWLIDSWWHNGTPWFPLLGPGNHGSAIGVVHLGEPLGLAGLSTAAFTQLKPVPVLLLLLVAVVAAARRHHPAVPALAGGLAVVLLGWHPWFGVPGLALAALGGTVAAVGLSVGGRWAAVCNVVAVGACAAGLCGPAVSFRPLPVLVLSVVWAGAAGAGIRWPRLLAPAATGAAVVLTAAATLPDSLAGMANLFEPALLIGPLLLAGLVTAVVRSGTPRELVAAAVLVCVGYAAAPLCVLQPVWLAAALLVGLCLTGPRTPWLIGLPAFALAAGIVLSARAGQIDRYACAVVFPPALYVLLTAWGPGSPHRRVVLLPVLALSIGLALPVTTGSEARDTLAQMTGLVPATDPLQTDWQRRLHAAQQTVPSGERLLACVSWPVLLDFRRNPVLVIDHAGVCSPPPGLPVDGTAGELRRALLGHGVRYVAFSHVDNASMPPGDPGLAGASADEVRTIRLYALNQRFRDHLRELMGRYLLHDDGRVAVIDLGHADQ